MNIELTPDEVEDIQRRLIKFINKVESSKARSKETYADAKHIVALLDLKKNKMLATLSGRFTKQCQSTKSSPGNSTEQTVTPRRRK